MSMTLIDRIETSSSSASITFNNIPQNYTDLFMVTSVRTTSTSGTMENIKVQVNESASSYSYKLLYGAGTEAGTYDQTGGGIPSDGIGAYAPTSTSLANTFGSMSVYIPNYAGSTHKSISIDAVAENNATVGFQNISSGIWANTAAITSVKIRSMGSNNLTQYSTASLYGINRQSTIGKPKAIGGAITFANGFWYHTFTGSGTFVPQRDITCEALVIAGGGGGAGAYGGAGAGGLLYSTLSLTPSSIPVTVGAGGVGANAIFGGNGANSSFSSLVAIGGGSGIADFSGRTGGSGGGAGGPSASYSAGLGIAGQGNNGGLGAGVSGYQAGGGGGGAGSVGGNSPGNQNGGNGGAGAMFGGWAQATSTGSSGYYAGGGGGSAYGNGGTSTGGSGGIGGGGQGAAQVMTSYLQYSTAGVANTGSGGGSGMNNSGSNGGSGIVIIRYPAE